MGTGPGGNGTDGDSPKFCVLAHMKRTATNLTTTAHKLRPFEATCGDCTVTLYPRSVENVKWFA